MATQVDARVIQVERAKLADKYEKGLRSIHRYVDRANRNGKIGSMEMLGEILNRLETLFPSDQSRS